MEKNDVLRKQEEIYFNSLSNEEKREYFVMFFEGEIILALKKRRRDEKITQAAIAKKMGVKQAYVSKIENLEKTPTIQTIAKYVYALDYSLEDVCSIVMEMTNNDDSLPRFSFGKSFKGKDDTTFSRRDSDGLKLAFRL